MSTVLVLRALGLGDAVTGMPALHLLRDALANSRILLAMPHRWEPLTRGAVDTVIDTEELAPLPAVATAGPVELAIDLHGNGPASRDLLAATHPQRMIAYASGSAHWNEDEHEVDRWTRLLREALPTAKPAPPLGGVLGRPPRVGMPEGMTVIHCGAKAASRRWSPARFAAVARLLHGEGHDVVVTGGPSESELATDIAVHAEVDVRTDLSLQQLMELVGTASLVVSGDTGVAHLASAYERPSVTLCGPVPPHRWGPPRHPRHRVLWHGRGTGDPHGAVIDPALDRITVGEVIAAVHEALPGKTVV